MKQKQTAVVTRRGAIRLAGAAIAAGAGAAGLKRTVPARADALKPGDPQYHFAAYEAIVNRDVTVRQLFQWPSIANRELWANLVNALNAWQFSYGVPADQIQIVVQAYASSTPAMLDDYLWSKYQLGAALQMNDAQGNPATANPFLHSKISMSAGSTPPADQSDPYYSDSSIEGVQRRGVLFLNCNNSLRGTASSAFQSGRNPDGLSLDALITEMQAHLIPGALLVPAGVTELVRLQDKGYRLVVNA